MSEISTGAPRPLPQKFTGKERDAETRLDFFGARYFSGAQGRFTSADPLPGWQSDPQSWNGYGYARNNPLAYTDPDGQTYRICVTGFECVDASDEDFARVRRNPGRGIGLWNGDINVFVNGEWVKTGTYWQTDVDLPFGVSMTLRAAGVTADRELKNAIRDVGIGVATGFAFSAAATSIIRATTIGAENLPLLRQVSKVISNNTAKHIVSRGHLAEFQKVVPGMTVSDVANLGIQVAQTGRMVGRAGRVFDRTVQLGGQAVTVRAVLTETNALRSVYILR